MKIVYMGTSEFAVPPLEKLLSNGYIIDKVVTQPDRRGNRGRVQESPVKEAAMKHGLEILQPERIKSDDDFMAMLEKLAPDLIIVAAFGQILPKRVIDIPRFGCLNIHGSLLPKYRGASPMQKAIADGADVSGVTIMKMDEGLDTGDIIASKEIKIFDKDIFQVTEELSNAGADLLINTIPLILKGRASYIKQDDNEASYTSLIKKRDGETDFSGTANEEKNKLKAFLKWPVLHSYIKGKSVKFFDADVIDDADESFDFGTVTDVTNDSFTIKCRCGSLIIKELQLEGKKRMKAGDFLRGFNIKIGDRFTKKNN